MVWFIQCSDSFIYSFIDTHYEITFGTSVAVNGTLMLIMQVMIDGVMKNELLYYRCDGAIYDMTCLSLCMIFLCSNRIDWIL